MPGFSETLTVMQPLALGAAMLAVIRYVLRSASGRAVSNVLLVVLVVCVSVRTWNHFVTDVLGGGVLTLGWPFTSAFWLIPPLIYCFAHSQFFPGARLVRYSWHALPFVASAVLTRFGLINTALEWDAVIILWNLLATAYLVAVGVLLYRVKRNKDSQYAREFRPAYIGAFALFLGFTVFIVFDIVLGLNVVFIGYADRQDRLVDILYLVRIGYLALLVFCLSYIDFSPIEIQAHGAMPMSPSAFDRRPARLSDESARALSEELSLMLRREEYYTDPDISLAGLADRLGVSTHVLSELLNRHLKTSFFQYINALRVDKAKSMLRNSPMPVVEVAAECGFNSRTTFYNAFRKYCGVTPAEFRRQPDVGVEMG